MTRFAALIHSRCRLIPGFIIACWATSALAGTDPNALQTKNWGPWEDVRSLYDAGKLNEALQTLQSKAPDVQASEDPSYYYNVGTILYQLGKLGQSVAYLEKANRLLPHNADIQHNLQLSRLGLSKLLGTENLDPASTWTETMADHTTLHEVRGALGLLGSILAVLWLRAYWKTRRLKRTLFSPAGIVGLAGFSIAFSVYAAERWASAHPPAVCIERQILRSGPGDHFLELGTVEAGMKIRLLGVSASSSSVQPNPTHEEVTQQQTQSAPQPQQWQQVRYSENGIGWIRSSSLLLL